MESISTWLVFELTFFFFWKGVWTHLVGCVFVFYALVYSFILLNESLPKKRKQMMEQQLKFEINIIK